MAHIKFKLEIRRGLKISMPQITSHYGLKNYMGITVVNTDRTI